MAVPLMVVLKVRVITVIPEGEMPNIREIHPIASLQIMNARVKVRGPPKSVGFIHW